MTGVSIGWFDPALFNHDIGYLTKRLKRAVPIRHKAWPLAVSSIRRDGKGTGVAYAIVGGHVPVHIDSVGLDDAGGALFHFVLETENRPAVLTAAATENNTPPVLGLTEVSQPFGLGVIELRVGMALHFDITTHFHGVTGLPVPMVSMAKDLSPRAVLVQVSGFEAHQIGDAVEHAREIVRLDRPVWDAGRAALMSSIGGRV
jgi:hypothetical protein